MNNEAGTMSERYKQELMAIYRSRGQADCPAEPEPAEPDPTPEPVGSEPDIDEKYPPPDLSELNSTDEEKEAELPEIPDIGSSEGFILVNVRTGGDAFPIENAAVTITAVTGGIRLLIAAASTDISGATVRLKVPAPDQIYSQTPDPPVRPYSLFDIAVTAEGYFNARSVDVPVFSGITSIQNFSMIPVPLYMKSTDETLTYYNQEPF